MFKKSACLFLFILLILKAIPSFAQPTLPEVGVYSKDGINVLSWINPFESGLKSIKVERSADSTYNFTTIGTVNHLTTKSQNFIDNHPLLGDNWYRVIITFNSDMEWMSNVVKIVVDSSSLLNQKQISNTDSLQKFIEQMDASEIVNQLSTVSYPKSRYVFTNPFTGNINIELEGIISDHYSVAFYDDQKKKVLEIPQINESVVILDKRNFQKTGLFSFKVFKNNQEFENGYVTIY